MDKDSRAQEKYTLDATWARWWGSQYKGGLTRGRGAWLLAQSRSSSGSFLLSRIFPEQHQTISIFRVAAGVGSTARAYFEWFTSRSHTSCFWANAKLIRRCTLSLGSREHSPLVQCSRLLSVSNIDAFLGDEDILTWQRDSLMTFRTLTS